MSLTDAPKANETPSNASVKSETPTNAVPDSEIPARSHELSAAERAKQILDERKGTITPFTQQKLPYFGEKPGWKRRWVLTENVPGRLQEGYTHVKNHQVQMLAQGIGFGNQDIGDNVAVFAGRGSLDRNGGQQYLYLMEIPQEIADKLHDIKVVQPTQATIAALKQGNPTGGPVDQHTYIAQRSGGIKIK